MFCPHYSTLVLIQLPCPLRCLPGVSPALEQRVCHAAHALCCIHPPHEPTLFSLTALPGVSPAALELADACAVVPMAGFVESFNISVAAALIMYEARRSREQALG